ncbi:MAG: hypothetical protein JWO32_1943 [Bacteroidetes bacterium]|jgi:hypothetical protein|nr:hypothetical protein [Bacteroidota bacterium]
MTLSEFNNFDLTQKSDLVWEWGHYLTSRKTETHNIVLFLVNDFLAEVHIGLTDHKTTHVKGISKTEIHPDFNTLLNNDDPFVKAFLDKKNSSSQQKSV